ncbi:MAG: hypothetical protein HQM03_07510 [Magnetococcales bacterium]|nr:hypothetical protein [Magnetococcales bacterium]
MKSTAAIRTTPPIPVPSDFTLRAEEGEDADALFLESLVAEANRTLDSLRAINLMVEEKQEDTTTVCVAYRESRRPIARIREEEIPDLAERIRSLQKTLLGISGAT